MFAPGYKPAPAMPTPEPAAHGDDRLPATGTAIPLLGAAVLAGAAVLIRRLARA